MMKIYSVSNNTENSDSSENGNDGAVIMPAEKMIPVAFTDQSSMASYLYHSSHTVKNTTPHAEVHSRDTWLGSATDQRLLFMFGNVPKLLRKVHYINYYNNMNGTHYPVAGTNNHGIKTCKLYAVMVPDFIPTTDFEAVGSELQELFSGDFERHEVNTIYELPAFDPPILCYGVVLDIYTNYGQPSTGLRRIFFTT
jgi:hypothetical protein